MNLPCLPRACLYSAGYDRSKLLPIGVGSGSAKCCDTGDCAFAIRGPQRGGGSVGSSGANPRVVFPQTACGITAMTYFNGAISKWNSSVFPSGKHLLAPLWFALKSRLLRHSSLSQVGTALPKVVCSSAIWAVLSGSGNGSIGQRFPRFDSVSQNSGKPVRKETLPQEA